MNTPRHLRIMVQATKIMRINLRCTNGILKIYYKPLILFNVLHHVIPPEIPLHKQKGVQRHQCLGHKFQSFHNLFGFARSFLFLSFFFNLKSTTINVILRIAITLHLIWCLGLFVVFNFYLLTFFFNLKSMIIRLA